MWYSGEMDRRVDQSMKSTIPFLMSSFPLLMYSFPAFSIVSIQHRKCLKDMIILACQNMSTILRSKKNAKLGPSVYYQNCILIN